MSTLVALSQIRTRLHFQETGEITHKGKVSYLIAFNILLLLLHLWIILALAFVIPNPNEWVFLACIVPLAIVDIYLVSRLFILTLKTRREIKQKYRIVRDGFHGVVELWLVSFCSCCVISQMGRHTADYNTFREVKLSSTGLPSNLEVLVPLVPKRNYEEEENDDSVYTF